MKKNNISLKFNHIYFSYQDDAQTLKDVSFEVEKGEYVCLIGHNGSGKSTIARLIIGLLSPKKGDIEIFGEKLSEDNVVSLRKKVGIVFQNPDNQFIGATVRDDIAFGLENECVEEERMEVLVDEYAKKVGMYEFLDKEPSSLSGGQKQRVAIAGTLVRNPSILILDEATSMLDPKGKREIIDLIHKTRQENPDLTIISITHDIEEAYSASKVIVISSGEIIASGQPKEVFTSQEKLEELELDLPFFLKLKKELSNRGIEINDVSSIEELKRQLC